MAKKSILLVLSLFSLGIPESYGQTSINEISLEKRATDIHQRVITIDTHNDIDVSNFTAEKNYTQDLDTQVNLPKMIRGGLDVTWLVVYTGQGNLDEEGYAKAAENAKSKFEAIHSLVEEIAPESVELALTSDEVRSILAKGKKVAMIGVENAYPIGTDLSNIEKYYDLGARYMSLSHNGHSQFCDSHTGEAEGQWLHEGLSPLGKQAIVEMNRLGIMIDLSHPSRLANKQTLELSKVPVIASHSSARALSDVSRNLDDELLLMLKKNGGVVQTVAFRQYVDVEKFSANDKASQEIYKAVAKELGYTHRTMKEISKLKGEELENAYLAYEEIMRVSADRKTEVNKKFPLVDVADFVDHIDYMVKLIGIDHVGISSDFDGGGGIKGWQDASESLNVTKELVRRGYTEEQIAKLWGLNLLRVLDEVQAYAEQQGQ